MIEIPGRIPIRIQPVFWLLVLLIGWLNSLSILGTVLWSFGIIVSLLIHEYGHALTALLFGQEAHIELMAIGGLTQRSGPPLKKWQEFLIVLNGPLAGFGLLVAAYYLRRITPGPTDSIPEYILAVFIYVNLFWTVLNLVPVHPLDGGRLLSIFLESLFGVKGIRASFLLSMIVASFLGVFFLTLQSLIAGALFLLFAFESFKGFKELQHLRDVDRNVDIQEDFNRAQSLMEEGKLDEAAALYQDVMSKSGQGLLFQAALETVAEIYLRQERYAQAFALLHLNMDKLTPQGILRLHEAAYKIGKWDIVRKVGNEAYQIHSTEETALINALSYAQSKEVKPAIGWIKCAMEQGLENPTFVLAQPAFDAIREDPLFREFKNEFSENS